MPAAPPIQHLDHPPTISPDAKIAQRQKPEDISNPFERQAAMIVDTAADWAERLAENLGEHPADSVPADPETVAEMFWHSPYGQDAPRVFWQQHEQLLQMAIAANDPDPYAVAERGALRDVYPMREHLGLLDSLGPEQRVQRAEQVAKMAHAQIVKGLTPDSMPTLVGPAGLPSPESTG